MNKIRVAALVSSLAISAAPLAAQTVTVNGSGTPYTSASPSPGGSDAACAGMLDTWCAYEVRTGASVGQTTTYARSGNGSLAYMSAQSSDKADFDIFFSSANQFRIKDLASLSYDWYRNGTSTIASHLHPAIRLIVEGPSALSAGTGFSSDALIFERIYNGGSSAPVNTWTTETIGLNTNLWWNRNMCNDGTDYSITLGMWANGETRCGGSILDNAKVIGFSVGIGSGWGGTFDGAIDNVSFQLNGQNQALTYNFEVGSQSVVPEPSTYALMFAGLAAVGVAARRRRK